MIRINITVEVHFFSFSQFYTAFRFHFIFESARRVTNFAALFGLVTSSKRISFYWLIFEPLNWWSNRLQKTHCSAFFSFFPMAWFKVNSHNRKWHINSVCGFLLFFLSNSIMLMNHNLWSLALFKNQRTNLLVFFLYKLLYFGCLDLINAHDFSRSKCDQKRRIKQFF